MKRILPTIILAVGLLSFPGVNFGQSITLGTASDFVLFSTVGAVTNTGISHITGNVGTNSGSSTGFGNVNGVMHDNDGASAQCAADLLIAYNQLNTTIPTFFPAPLLGNGQTLYAGVYHITSPATLNLGLTLDAQGDPNAVFIFQIQAAFSTGAFSIVNLANGAKACNVYWKVEGLVSMATGTTMRGNVIANNAAIEISTGGTLEGRALSTTGAITVHGVLAYTPTGCGSPVLTGPMAPALASTACYALFSSDGPVTNAGITHVRGDVGTNVGLTTGFNPLFVTGYIHPIPDGSTAQCAADLLSVYTYLNTLPTDIELLYPAQFGNNLVLTPHTYLLNAATSFTDSLFLNAQGDTNAVFVIKINGALSTSTYSKVLLINGAKAKNVFWKVDGAVSINDYSIFKGTIVCNNGAIDLTTGVTIDGRALTTTGALQTAAINATIPPGCLSGNGNSLSGVVQYDNTLHTPMSNTTVYLKSGESVIATTTTNNSGVYSFAAVPSGIYTLDGSSNKTWGGGNSTDALLIEKHFVGLSILNGIRLSAADVDNSDYVNSIDAMMVMKRFVGIINSFPSGNWLFNPHSVTLSGNGIFTDNLKALCYGDVNGSYNPPVKVKPTVFLEQNGSIAINLFEEFELPLLTTLDMTVGAISMVLNFPKDLVEVTDVAGPTGHVNNGVSGDEKFLYTMNNGELRLSWYSIDPLTIMAHQPIISLKMKILPQSSQINAEFLESNLVFLMDGESEIVNENEVQLENVNLVLPKLILKSDDFVQSYNYPNPFTNTTEIAYTLPWKSKVKLSVFNTLGVLVEVLADEQKEAGIYKDNFNTQQLHPGVYYYRLEVTGLRSEYTLVRKMIMSK
ncbi:MAG: ice-binding family protein [Bacteroidetes bacterium]|nr:ice-binding family protein [Bacteroidota bacterium]